MVASPLIAYRDFRAEVEWWLRRRDVHVDRHKRGPTDCDAISGLVSNNKRDWLSDESKCGTVEAIRFVRARTGAHAYITEDMRITQCRVRQFISSVSRGWCYTRVCCLLLTIHSSIREHRSGLSPV